MSHIIDLIIDIDGEPLQLTGNVDNEEIIGLGNGSNDTIHFKPYTGKQSDLDKLASISSPQDSSESVSDDSGHISAMILDHEMTLYRESIKVFVSSISHGSIVYDQNTNPVFGDEFARYTVDAFRKYFNLDSEDT